MNLLHLINNLTGYYDMSAIDSTLLNYYTQSQINTLLNLKQNNITSIAGDGFDLSYSSTQLNKSYAGNNISITRINAPGFSFDKQISFDVVLSQYTTNTYVQGLFTNYYDKTYIDASFYD